MWFSTFSSLGIRMRMLALVCPLFGAQTTWFGIPDFRNAKGEWVEHGVEDHEIRDSNNV